MPIPDLTDVISDSLFTPTTGLVPQLTTILGFIIPTIFGIFAVLKGVSWVRGML